VSILRKLDCSENQNAQKLPNMTARLLGVSGSSKKASQSPWPLTQEIRLRPSLACRARLAL